MDRSLPESRNRCAGDDGLAMALMGLFMVVLLAFVGFAVDIGMLYNERRQEQSAADTAVLAAVVDDNWNDRLDTVFRMVNASGDSVYTEADWNDNLKCPTSDMPAGFTKAPAQTAFDATADPSRTANLNTQCVAYSGDPSSVGDYQLWVRVPDTDVTTTFAGLVGVNSMRTSAFAIAGYEVAPPATNFLPFAYSSAANGNGGTACLQEPPSGLAINTVCPGPNSGNFGWLDLMRPNDFGTSDGCSNSFTAERIHANISSGLDHQIFARNPITLPKGDDWSPCPLPSQPNHVHSSTGASGKTQSAKGFLQSTLYSGPRLKQIPADADTGRTWKTANYQPTGTTFTGVDNMGLWEFIGTDGESFGGTWATPWLVTPATPGAQDAAKHTWTMPVGKTLPGICDPNVATWVDPAFDSNGPAAGGVVATRSWPWNRTRIIHCMYAIDQSLPKATSTVFDRDSNGDGTYDLQHSPRFTYVPESWIDINTCTGNCDWSIKRFRPMYIDVVWYIKGNTWCSFTPGEGQAGTCAQSSGAFRAVSGLFFDVPDDLSGDPTMLPDELNQPVSLEPPYPSLIR